MKQSNLEDNQMIRDDDYKELELKLQESNLRNQELEL